MRTSAPPRTASSGVWIGRLGLPLYLPVLFFGLRDAGLQLPSPSLGHLRSTGDVLTLAGTLLVAVLLQAAFFVPAGFLAALAFGPRPVWLDRLVGVWLPAAAISIAVVTGARVLLAGHPWSWPTPADLVLPAVGAAFGVAAGVAWSHGWRSRRRFLASLTVFAILAVLAVAYAATLVFEAEPLDFAPTAVTSAEKKRVYRLFRGKNPKGLGEGKTQVLSLAPHDVNVLLSWGLSLGEPDRKAQVEFDTEYATFSMSARLPGRRYLNVVSGTEVSIDDGRLRVLTDALRIGRLDLPSWLLRALSPAVAHAVAADRRVKSALAPIRTLSIEPSSARLAYGHAEVPKGFVADLFHGEGSGSEDLPVAQAHARHLVEVAARLPSEGEARFGAALQAAFTYARERSGKGDPVLENRGAVLALGILIGHWRVQTLVGPVLDKESLQAGLHAYRGLTLRRRNDWTKHFMVSASLTVLSAGTVSDATGLFKEELDADGGSGFSFGDLVADRSGTNFAQAATRDEAAARAMQTRLAAGFRVDDFFPPAADLPEGMQDAEFQARYGGVGGAEYRRVVEEIERRLARCEAYREVKPTSR